MMNKLDAHHRLLISLFVAVTSFFLFKNHHTFPSSLMASWLCFALTHLFLSWYTIFSQHPLEVKKIASIQDSSRTWIFIFILFAAIASLCAVILLLKSSKTLNGVVLVDHIILSLGSVVCAWFLVHTLFTFRYAHLFYNNDSDNSNKGKGLEFPNEKNPDYLDFAYFSFVLGMTFQVSDVEISSRKIRRLALLHSLISFIFNTAILALSINIISGLI
ncbi:MAG: DUF1345 domain-containing protein [Sphingobacteriales bacterium]|nr:DUF1345 domain-containing protein [Sphingobacteriales bacterium]